MNIKFSYLVFFILMNVSIFAEDRYTKLYDKCIKDGGGATNTLVYMCSEDVSSHVKKDMNRLYNNVYIKIASQSKSDAKQFEKSQYAWISYRNNHCEIMGSYIGSPMYSYCPMELNKLRVEELQQLAGE